jgi:hypothetical protein
MRPFGFRSTTPEGDALKFRPVLAAAVAAALTLPAGAGMALATSTDSPVLYKGNLRDCDDVREKADIDIKGRDLIRVEGAKSDSNKYVSGTVSYKGKVLDVEALKENVVITAVVVKGGTDSHVYLEEPFTGLRAPRNPGGQKSEISHWFVCGFKKHKPEPEPTKTETPEPEPTKTETPEPEPTKTETPEPEPTKTDEPKPEPTETKPVAVPTAVPAGTAGDGGSGAGALLAGVVLLGAGTAGIAAVARRRQVNGV